MSTTHEHTLRRTRIAGAGVAVVMFAIGSVAVANGNGNHTCTKCHTEDETLCDSRECASNEVCTGEEGTSDTSSRLWVQAICERKDAV